MFAALRKLHRHVVRTRFERLVRSYDERIEQARKAHRPTRHIEAEKRAFVQDCLRGAR